MTAKVEEVFAQANVASLLGLGATDGGETVLNGGTFTQVVASVGCFLRGPKFDQEWFVGMDGHAAAIGCTGALASLRAA